MKIKWFKCKCCGEYVNTLYKKCPWCGGETHE